MATDQPRPDEWIALAVEQAAALRATVRDDPVMGELVDLLLFELAQRIIRENVDEAQ